LEKSRRKEIARAWRERQRSQGVFAVRCAVDGQAWVAASRNLDTAQNAVWFALRQGGHPNRALAAAWAARGEAAFAFEILEAVEKGDLTDAGLGDLLKARERHWREKIGAAKLAG
jgi:hypothetical protein